MKNPFTKTRKLEKIVVQRKDPEQPYKFIAEVVEWRFFSWVWWSSQILLWRSHDGDFIGSHIQLPD